MKRKKIKYLTYILSLVLILVAPLISFAKDGVKEIGPIKLVFEKKGEDTFEDLSFDYWKIDDDLTKEDRWIKEAKKYENMSKKELDERFGPSNKTNPTKSLDDRWSILTFDKLKEGSYIFKIDDESFEKLNTYSIPVFYLRMDEALMEEMDVYPKTIKKSIKLNKIDKDSKKSLSKVEFEFYEVDDANKEVNLKLKKLEDGKYTIIDGDSEKGDPILTDSNGNIEVISIKKDKSYIFKEIKALAGYKNENLKSKKLRSGDIVTLENEKKPVAGRIKFRKVDESDNTKGLANAEFVLSKRDEKTGKYQELYDKNDKSLVFTSDKDGYFLIKDLAYGKYLLKEIKAPKGYILSSDPISFEISDKNSSENIELKPIENEKSPPSPPPSNPPRRLNPPPGRVSSIVKTGDIKIFIFAIVGIVLIVLGRRLLKEAKEIE